MRCSMIKYNAKQQISYALIIACLETGKRTKQNSIGVMGSKERKRIN